MSYVCERRHVNAVQVPINIELHKKRGFSDHHHVRSFQSYLRSRGSRSLQGKEDMAGVSLSCLGRKEKVSSSRWPI